MSNRLSGDTQLNPQRLCREFLTDAPIIKESVHTAKINRYEINHIKAAVTHTGVRWFAIGVLLTFLIDPILLTFFHEGDWPSQGQLFVLMLIVFFAIISFVVDNLVKKDWILKKFYPDAHKAFSKVESQLDQNEKTDADKDPYYTSTPIRSTGATPLGNAGDK